MITSSAQRQRAPAKLPPPPDFSLSTLPDDTHLTQKEVAGYLRQTLSWTEKCRLDRSDELEWVYIDHRPRCIVGSLKKKMAGSPNKGPRPRNLVAKDDDAPKAAPPMARTKPAKRRAMAGAR